MHGQGEDEMHGEEDELLLLPAPSLPQLATGTLEAPLEVVRGVGLHCSAVVQSNGAQHRGSGGLVRYAHRRPLAGGP